MNLTRKGNNWFLGNNGHLTWLGIWLILAVITILSFLLVYPRFLVLEALFFDSAAGLKLDYLISKGLIPEVDFRYGYGLPPLIIGHIWYEIFGRTLQAFCGLRLFCEILTVAAMARIAYFANLKPTGIFLIAVTIPFSLLSWPWLNLVHVLEPFFICLALSEQLAGRKQYALVALIFGWFTKPSMSIVYIFFLFLTYLFDIYTKKISVRNFIYQLRFPFLTFVALIVLVSINFGNAPILSTLIPIKSRQVYKDYGWNGFFSDTGRNFWGPSGAKITYYLGTSAGLWIFLTVLLIFFVVYMCYGEIKKNSNEKIYRISETSLTILCLHLSFIFFFYGSPNSWTSYSYLIPIGVSLIASRNIQELKNLRIFLISLAIVIAMLCSKQIIKNSFSTWMTTRPQVPLAGLWLDKAGKTAFTNLIDSCKVKDTLIYNPGALDLYFPFCHMPISFYPLTDAEISDRNLIIINKQFEEAQQLVVLTSSYPNITKLSKLKQKFAKFEFDHKDKMFTYLRRKN